MSDRVHLPAPVYRRGVLSSLVVILLASCNSAGPTVIPASPAPVSTRTPLPTGTPTSTPSPTPLPTISAESLTRDAGPLCDAAFASKAELQDIDGALVALRSSGDSWTFVENFLPYAQPVAQAELRSVACIRQGQEKMFTYRDHQPGYRLLWDVRIIAWPDGKVLGSKSFRGDSPPGIKYGDGPAYGRSPGDQAALWVIDHLRNKTFFYVGDRVTSLVFSPDGRQLAVGKGLRLNVTYVNGSFDGRITIFNVPGGENASVLNGHKQEIHGSAFSPDGQVLASCADDQTLRIWDVKTGKQLHKISFPALNKSIVAYPSSTNCYGATFSPDGSLMAVSTSHEILWVESKSGKIVHSFPEYGAGFFAPDNQTFIISSYNSDPDRPTIKLIDIATLETKRTFQSQSPAGYFGTDGHLFGVAGGWDQPVQIWDVEADQMIRSFTTYGSNTTHVAMTQGGLLAMSDEIGTVTVWSIETGQQVQKMTAGGNPFTALALSPDGKLLATGDGLGTVRLWDIQPAP